MNGKVFKVVIYARVSTTHHGQDPEVQLVELRSYCQARNLTIVEEIRDHGYSGGTDARPGLKKLMMLARSRKIDAVVIVKLDRLFRSLKHLVNTMDELKALGVEFVSLKDSLDFTTPAGRLLFGVLASLAEFEKDLVRERTLAGLAHARRKGKQLGRPTHDTSLDTRIIQLHTEGQSYRKIERMLGISRATVYRVLKVAQKPPSKSVHQTTENQDVTSDE